VGSKRRIFSATELRFGRSRSSKVDDFGTNQKHVCDFLLVPHCDSGPILHRFWDAATYWLKSPIFPTPLSFGAAAPYVPFGISDRAEVNHEETRVMGLSYTEDPMIVVWVILTQCQRVVDRQTDRQTDGFTIASTALCIASYTDALWKRRVISASR